jgi:uncharacterized protein with HEPN domain
MSQRDPSVYLEDIEYYTGLTISFTSSLTLEQYLADALTRAAVERVLGICSEAMNQLHRDAPTVVEKLPHARGIIGFRKLLAHAPTELDQAKIYNIAFIHAPVLLGAVQEALKAFPPSESRTRFGSGTRETAS